MAFEELSIANEQLAAMETEQAVKLQTDQPETAEVSEDPMRLTQAQLRKIGGTAHSASAVYPGGFHQTKHE